MLKMTDNIQMILLVIVATVVPIAMVIGLKWVNEATVSTSVVEVSDSVKCYRLITTDGVAVDCWKVDKND